MGVSTPPPTINSTSDAHKKHEPAACTAKMSGVAPMAQEKSWILLQIDVMEVRNKGE